MNGSDREGHTVEVVDVVRGGSGTAVGTLAPAPERTSPGPKVDEGRPGGDDGPPPAGPLPRAAAALAALAVLVAGVAALLGDVGLLPGGTVARVETGSLELAVDGGWRTLTVGEELRAGSRVRTDEELAELTAGSARLTVVADTELVLHDDRFALERGTVAIEDDQPVTVEVDAITAVGAGTWRVDDGGRPRVGVYEGGPVTVDDGDVASEVPSLRELSVRDGAAAARGVVPLRYDGDDPVDVRHLAEALRVDELAATLRRSLAGTHGDAPREPAFYDSFTAIGDEIGGRLTELAPQVDGDRLGPPADVLVAVAVIDVLRVDTDRTTTEAAAEVARLRGAGAAWGLIVVGAGADGDALLAAADRALERAEEQPPPPAPEPEPATEADEPTTPPAPEPDPPSGASPPAPSPGSGTPSPPSSPAPDPGGGGGSGGGGSEGGGSGGGLLSPVEDTVRGLGDAVQGLTDGVGDVVGGVDELLSPGGLLGGR